MFSQTDYDTLLDQTIEQMEKLGKLKGGEYTGGNRDRLANFRHNALDLDVPMEEIWYIYCKKHWDAITTYISDLRHGRMRERMEPLEGRVDDIIVYMILFKCMLKERADRTTPVLK